MILFLVNYVYDPLSNTIDSVYEPTDTQYEPVQPYSGIHLPKTRVVDGCRI